MNGKFLGFVVDTLISFALFSVFIGLVRGFDYYIVYFIPLLFCFLAVTMIYDLVFKPSDYRFNLLWHTICKIK